MTAHQNHPANQFARLLEFVAELDRRQASYSLASHRDDAVMVKVAVPGQRWEIEFMNDGEIEIERFISSGEIGDRQWLEQLWSLLE